MGIQEGLRHTVGRRQFLKGAGVGGFGLAGAALLGCGDGKKSDVDPKIPIATPAPTTINRTGSAPDTAPTRESQKEGVISVGNFQLEVQGWQEQNFEPTPRWENPASTSATPKKIREGWKYVIVNTRLRNTSKNLANIEDAVNNISRKFVTDGFSYPASDVDEYNALLVRRDNGTPSPFLPPSISSRVNIAGWVPIIKNDYTLNIADKSGNLLGTMKRGEKTSTAVASEDVNPTNISQSLIIPSYAKISFVSAGNDHITLAVENDYGMDIDVRQISVYTALRDGRLIQTASKLGLSDTSISKVPPGTKKDVRIVQKYSDDITYPDLDPTTGLVRGFRFPNILPDALRGGIVMVYFNKQAITWEIPTK